MRFKERNYVFLMLCLVFIFGVGFAPVAAADTGTEKTQENWRFHDIVDVDFVQQYAKMPQPKGVVLIDSRPYKGKFSIGHIPTAVSIPDSQFDKMTDKLPQDKSILLIFYCQGPT